VPKQRELACGSRPGIFRFSCPIAARRFTHRFRRFPRTASRFASGPQSAWGASRWPSRARPECGALENECPEPYEQRLPRHLPSPGGRIRHAGWSMSSHPPPKNSHRNFPVFVSRFHESGLAARRSPLPAHQLDHHLEQAWSAAFSSRKRSCACSALLPPPRCPEPASPFVRIIALAFPAMRAVPARLAYVPARLSTTGHSIIVLPDVILSSSRRRQHFRFRQ